VTAEAIVQATDSPINVNLAVHARQSAYRSYVTGYKIPKVCNGDILSYHMPQHDEIRAVASGQATLPS